MDCSQLPQRKLFMYSRSKITKNELIQLKQLVNTLFSVGKGTKTFLFRNKSNDLSSCLRSSFQSIFKFLGCSKNILWVELIPGSPLFFRLQIRNLLFVILCNYIVDNATFENDIHSNYNIGNQKKLFRRRQKMSN